MEVALRVWDCVWDGEAVPLRVPVAEELPVGLGVMLWEGLREPLGV